ncbi:plasmid mobilization relaxosome protein MobC [Comamonas sp. JUb58]|uniref:plasmid mobilization protein n=1 Tax=Comamonas sp. JUb58 TaxID=2485114 RepID=UPI00106201B5|nr:plasmid mobilization relaxosome protein MobC [Comamonas sp. JUb58]
MQEKRLKIKSGRSDRTDTCQYVRTKQIHIRASEEEFKEIEKKAIEQKKSIAKYLRDTALTKHQAKKYINNENMYLTVSMLNQIQKIGTNVNQIAYKLNSHSATKQDIQDLKEVLQELRRLTKRGNR